MLPNEESSHIWPNSAPLPVFGNENRETGGIVKLFRLLTALIVMLVLSALTPTGARAGDPISGASFHDMEVDETTGNIFVSQGHFGTEVLVLDLEGNIKTRLDVGGQAHQLLVSQDGTKLYVALPDQQALGVIDPETLDLQRIPLGADTCPTSIAEVGTVLWFSTDASCDVAGHYLGSLDLDTGTVTRYLGNALTVVGASPRPDRLLVRRPDSLVLLDISEGPGVRPTEVASRPYFFWVEPVIAEDGSRFLSVPPISLEEPCRVAEYASSNLASSATSYVCSPHAGIFGIAVRQDGLIALSASGPLEHIRYYRQGESALWGRYRFPDAGDQMLTFSATDFGQNALYVARPGGGSTFQVTRIVPMRLPSLSVTTPQGVYSYGSTAKVVARLKVGPPGAVVKIYAQPVGRPRILLASGPVNAAGELSASMRLGRNTTLLATFDGDPVWDPARASKLVKVGARTTLSLTNVVGRSGKYRLVRSGVKARAIGTVAPNHAGDCAKIQVQEPQWGRWGYNWLSDCFRLSTASQVYIWFTNSWTPGSHARVRLVWAGDDMNSPSRSPWTYIRFVR